MVAPVSASVAVPYANYSASDRGTNANCPWNSSLVTSAKVATAEITVKTRTSGVQPAFLAASLEGMVYTSRGYTVSLSGEDSIEAAPLLTVSDSCNVSDYSYYGEVTGAVCNFTAMGSPAGNELSVGQIII